MRVFFVLMAQSYTNVVRLCNSMKNFYALKKNPGALRTPGPIDKERSMEELATAFYQ
jgi:hypothetical protein